MSEPSLGERLKAERERRGLGTQKIADDLHLDPWVIEALEAGDYARIGPAVYAKGYLRKYASTLGVAVGDLVIGAEPRLVAPSSPAAGLGMRVQGAPGPLARLRLGLLGPLLALVIVAAIAALLWWHPWRARTGAGNAVPARSAAPAHTPAAPGASGTVLGSGAGAADAPAASPPAAAAAMDAAAPGAAPDADEAPPSHASSGEGAPGAPSASVATPNAAGGAVTAASGTAAPPAAKVPAGVLRAHLKLSFSADSWVEVRDSTGRRVFAGQGRANSVKTIAGLAPLQVYLGYASGVQLEINDRAVAIGRQFMAGDVARFEAGADGSLRRLPGGAAVRDASVRAPLH